MRAPSLRRRFRSLTLRRIRGNRMARGIHPQRRVRADSRLASAGRLCEEGFWSSGVGGGVVRRAGGVVVPSGGRACLTDVTGFGLLGHLHALARESGVAAEVHAATGLALEGVEVLLADDGAVSRQPPQPRVRRGLRDARGRSSSRGASASCASPRPRAGRSSRRPGPDGRGAWRGGRARRGRSAGRDRGRVRCAAPSSGPQSSLLGRTVMTPLIGVPKLPLAS
jgi:AIR synthase related protein, C-terminal domain